MYRNSRRFNSQSSDVMYVPTYLSLQNILAIFAKDVILIVNRCISFAQAVAANVLSHCILSKAILCLARPSLLHCTIGEVLPLAKTIDP